MKQAISSIRQQIKQNMAASREIRKHIHESSGMERWGWWQDKRDLGDHTRYLYLALAALRGRSYGTVERSTRRPPSAETVLHGIRAALGPESPEAASWDLGRVKAWLKPSEPTTASVEAA